MQALVIGAEIMGNQETLFSDEAGQVTKLFYNTPAFGYPKTIAEEFPGIHGINQVFNFSDNGQFILMNYEYYRPFQKKILFMLLSYNILNEISKIIVILND